MPVIRKLLHKICKNNIGEIRGRKTIQNVQEEKKEK